MSSRSVAIVTGVILAGLALIEWRPWTKWGHGESGVSAAEVSAPQIGVQGDISVISPKVPEGLIAQFVPPASGFQSTQPQVSQSQASQPQQAQSLPKLRQEATTVVIAEKNDAPKQAIRAQLSPVQFTTIVSEINGKVSALPVREGETFADGQLLVSFDCALQEAQLQKVTAQLQIAQRKYETNRKLLERGSVSKVETENSASELDRARAEVKELSILLSKCRIDAPYKGKVVEQKVRALQFVQVGQPLMEILDNSLMELEFIAPSAWMPWIKVGQKFQISIDETNKSYPAQVTRIGAKIDSVSQTVKVVAVVDGAFPELSPGMSGTVHIEAALKEKI